MKSPKHLPGVLAAASVLAVVVSGGIAPASARPSSAPVSLNFLYRITTPQDDQYEQWLVSSFNAANQGKIHVTYSGIPDNNYKAKINLVLRDKHGPDVFFSWEGGYAKYMIDSGYAQPLDSYYDKYHWTSMLNPAASQLATLEGHKYFLPYYMSASVIWYNTALYKKYNLHVPTTWAQLAANAAVLKSHGIAPFLLANQQQWEAQFDWTGYFVNKNGVAAYNALLNRQIPWTDPRVVDAFAQLKTMKDNGWFLNGVNSMDFDTTAIIFWKKQQAAMWYQGSFILPKFLDANRNLTYPVDWFPYPQIGSQTPTVSVFAESTYMINKKSQHKDEAAAFLNYVVSKTAQSHFVASVGPFAANASVTPAGEPPMVQRLGALISKYKTSTFMHVDHALGPDVSQRYLEVLQGVLAGNVTPAKAAADTEAAALRSQGPVKK
ncbi:MAG: extracellular solute-binding protein [Chloroflexi bacterium]|nr:extracellular solute-binding protein [Chloroflexota bacterium]